LIPFGIPRESALFLVGRQGLEPGTYGLKEPALCEGDQEVESVCDPNGTLCFEVAKGILIAAAEERDVDWGDAERLAREWLATTGGTLAMRVLAEGEHAAAALVELCVRIVGLSEPDEVAVEQGGES
jgi:hypothetical protein